MMTRICEELIQFANDHAITYRVIANKVVLTHRDGYAEAYFFFDENGNYLGDLPAELAQFMALDARRYRVISAFTLRAAELGAKVYYNHIETPSYSAYGIGIDYRLNEILENESDDVALRHLLSNLSMYTPDATVSRLLEQASQTQLAQPVHRAENKKTLPESSASTEPTLQNILSDVLSHAEVSIDDAYADGKLSDEVKSALEEKLQQAKTEIAELELDLFDFTDYEDEEKIQEQSDFEACFDAFYQTLPLKKIPLSDFPSDSDYARFDQWAMEKILAFRQSPTLDFFDNAAMYQASDWYVSPADWSRAVDNELNAHRRYWGSYGYIKFALNTVTESERQEAIKWATDWLASEDDFDGYYPIMPFLLDDVPELAREFEDIESVSVAIDAWRVGVHHAEYFIRYEVLHDWRDEDESAEQGDNDNADYFDAEALSGRLTASEIQQLFTPEELAMGYRYALSKIAQGKTEEDFIASVRDYLALAVKLNWTQVLSALRQHHFLPHVLWQTTRNEHQVTECFEYLKATFIAHLRETNHPQQEAFTREISRSFDSDWHWLLLNSFGFDEDELLWWTLSPSLHDFIRPYFAYMIAQKIANPNTEMVIRDEMILAIGWSRLRREEINASI